MAVIHRTTMTPGKLELLASWLPAQPWYAGLPGRDPQLAKAGGFRLDDPEGEVGIEFMVVTDTADGTPVAYHVPLTYRGAPLDGAEQALVGTSEHGVLGLRWVYDGTRDPVLVARLRALLRGEAVPQMQSESGTPDPTVTVEAGGVEGADLPDRDPAADDGLAVTVTRVLNPRSPADGADRARVTAEWHAPDGESSRAVFAVLRRATA
ncbi:1,4-alpha-glucan branching protein [Streptomyces sp. NPDC051183]|uniref:maltokinase N-terminal cap-like domain-containing protein n=1 Tax=Streptomyces sp. NPDC051183 TaxID=3155165 RepID=UPI00343851C2